MVRPGFDIFYYANSGLSGTKSNSKVFVSKLVSRSHKRETIDGDTAVGYAFEMGMLLISTQDCTQAVSVQHVALFICEINIILG